MFSGRLASTPFQLLLKHDYKTVDELVGKGFFAWAAESSLSEAHRLFDSKEKMEDGRLYSSPPALPQA
jgi:hypothetical protein